MALRARGHIPDKPDVVARRLGFHLHPNRGAIQQTVLPLETANGDKLWGIWDQHDASGCEGCAHSSALTLRLALAGTPLSEPISNVGLYLGALMVDRQPDLATGTLPRLFDTGTMPSSILSALSLWGASGESVWGQQPMGSQTMYETPSNSNSPLIEPKVEQLYAESAMRFGGAFFVQTLGLQKVLDVLRALASGYPVSIAIPASGSEFQGYSGGVLSALAGDVDHANFVCDYKWTGSQQQFDDWQGGMDGLDQYLNGVGVNSWGTQWGESDASGIPGGMYRFNRAFFDQMQDPCIMNVARAA